jgi:hypothetical protein
VRTARDFPLPLKKGTIEVEEGMEDCKGAGEARIDVPNGTIARGMSTPLSWLITVVGLQGGGGSRVTGGLSAPGRANVAVHDRSDDFTFMIGDHRYLCPSSVARFLSPRVSKLHWIDSTISELTLEAEDGDELFGSVLEAVSGGSIAVDSANSPTSKAICATLWNSEFCESVYSQ